MSENKQVQENQEEQTVEVMAEIQIKLYQDGKIELNVKDDETDVLILEDMLKKSYDSIHEQRIIQMALDAFKNKLS